VTAPIAIRTLVTAVAVLFVGLFSTVLVRLRRAPVTAFVYEQVVGTQFVQEVLGPNPSIGWRRFFYRVRGGVGENVTWVGLPLMGNGREIMVSAQVSQDGSFKIERVKARYGERRLKMSCAPEAGCKIQSRKGGKKKRR
jgi:hypothetical protein